MEPNEKPKIDWTRLLTTAVIVLVTALVVGGTTWYAMDKSAKEIKTANDKTVSELKKELGNKVAVPTTIATDSKTNTYTDSTGKYSVNIPEGYVATASNNCEGGCVSILTLNKKINDVSYGVLHFNINVNQYGEQMTLDQWNTNTDFLKGNSTLGLVGVKNIGGKSFSKYQGAGFAGTYTHYRLFSNMRGYDINYVNDLVDAAVVDSIISSFKFN